PDFILPADQLAPAVLPTKAPEFVVAKAQPAAPVAPKPDFILPADQLAPAVLPTKAPEFVVAKAQPAAPVAPKPDFILPSDQLAPAVLPTKAPEFTNNIPTLRAVAVGNPEDQRFASGKVIIRRGDNLWTIARRVYGFGIRYIAIFEANKNKIRDPDLIYPGQVFDLPEDKQANNK
ncbi:LysM domain protein, partial [hydrothermal vent metagenome]